MALVLKEQLLEEVKIGAGDGIRTRTNSLKAIVLAVNTTPAQTRNYNKKGGLMLPILLFNFK